MRPAVPRPGSDPECFPMAGTMEDIPPLPVIPLPPRPSLPPLPAVDAHEVIGGVVQEHGTRIRAKRLKVSLRLLARSYHMPADPERLRQIVRSLVRTAVESARPGGKITIRSSCPSDCALRLEVEEKL